MVQKLLVRRSLILLLLLLIVPLGIFSKAYGGIGQEWVKDYSGDVLYEIFWCLFVFWFIRPSKDRSKLRQIAVLFDPVQQDRVNYLWSFILGAVT